MIASGMVSYCGPFTSEYRKEMVENWYVQMKEMCPFTEDATLYSLLGDPVKVQEWVVCSLPNDALSVENGIVMDKCRRWPLMIDPQRQANKYLRKLGAREDFAIAGMDVCKLSDANFLRTLELGIQFGKWILLENIG